LLRFAAKAVRDNTGSGEALVRLLLAAGAVLADDERGECKGDIDGVQG
jgi:hypothetical protein